MQFPINLILSFLCFLQFGVLAHASKPIECRFSQRFSFDYEEINDFVFEDYPWLTVESVENGWEVSVGGMTYGDEYSGTLPAQIQKKELADNKVVYESLNPDEPWQLLLDLTEGTALFSFNWEGHQSTLSRVALFICDR